MELFNLNEEKLDQLFENSELNPKNDKIADIEEFDNLDIFGYSQIEKIKNNPEYIFLKLRIHFLKFVSLENYFFILKKSSKSSIKSKTKEKKKTNETEIAYKKEKNKDNPFENRKKNIISKEKKKKQNNLSDIKKEDENKNEIKMEKKFNSFEIKIEDKNKREIKMENKYNSFEIINKNKNDLFEKFNNIEKVPEKNVIQKNLSDKQNIIFDTSGNQNILNNLSSDSNNQKTKSLNNENIKYSDSSKLSDSLQTDNSIINLSYDQSKIFKCCGIKEIQKKESEDLNEFKLHFFKKTLNFEEIEKLNGKSYEDLSRNTFRLMLILILKSEVIFENPKNINNNRLINFYLKKFSSLNKEAPVPIFNTINENLNKNFEVDILYELKEKKFHQFIDKYYKHILISNINIENNINEEEKKIFPNYQKEYITLMVEIARDFINQSVDKLEQISNYTKVITVMNYIQNEINKNNNIDIKIKKQYQEITKEYHCNEKNKKMFVLITDGNYNILYYVINVIIKPLLKDYSNKKLNFINYNDVKDKIFISYEKAKNDELKDKISLMLIYL